MTRNGKLWIVGGVAAALIAVACVGTLAVGMMFARPRFGGMMYGPQQGPAQIAPNAPNAQDGAPDGVPQAQPNQRGYRGDGFGMDRNFGRQMPRYGNGFNRGFGMGPLGFIGGFFRLLLTIALIGLAFMVLRRLFFGRGPRWGWGGPGRWGGPGGPGAPGAHGEVPAWAEDWHRKMHEKMEAPVAPAAPVAPVAPVAEPDAGASAPAAPAADAPPPADTSDKQDEGKLV